MHIRPSTPLQFNVGVPGPRSAAQAGGRLARGLARARGYMCTLPTSTTSGSATCSGAAAPPHCDVRVRPLTLSHSLTDG